eukprot:2797513-Amphidinium_carterae.1
MQKATKCSMITDQGREERRRKKRTPVVNNVFIQRKNRLCIPGLVVLCLWQTEERFDIPSHLAALV